LNAGVFQKRYPGIKVVQVVGQGTMNIYRILAERRANRHLADLQIGGVTNQLDLYAAKALDPIKPRLILPEVTDGSNWWRGAQRYADPEGQYIFNYVGVPQGIDVSYNTNLVNPAELSSLEAVLNPKWKGKIVVLDIRAGGPGGGALRFVYHHPKYGPSFIRRFFSSMEVTLSRDRRQTMDWLGTGKFALCFLCSDSDVRRAKQQGLPMDSVDVVEDMAGLVAQGGSVSLLRNAPHPNAARVFINWLLSRDGQSTVQRAIAQSGGVAPDSLRVDIPKDDVPPKNRRREGMAYLEMDIPSRLDMGPIVKLMEEALLETSRR
jgi:iron(III) transport system substrate-binding protein